MPPLRSTSWACGWNLQDICAEVVRLPSSRTPVGRTTENPGKTGTATEQLKRKTIPSCSPGESPRAQTPLWKVEEQGPPALGQHHTPAPSAVVPNSPQIFTRA